MELSFQGPEGRLQAKLWEPEEASGVRAACVVCHPHPQRGGTLDTTVVFRVARAMQEAGLPALRFNFRGVGESEGRYHGEGGPGSEEDDVVAALDELERRYPGVELWAAGFSFGARTVAALASREARIRRVVLVALPVRVFDCSAVERLRTPGLAVQGAEDDFGTLADLEQSFPGLEPTLERVEIPEADHFFRKRTKELQALIRDHASQWLEASTT